MTEWKCTAEGAGHCWWECDDKLIVERLGSCIIYDDGEERPGRFDSVISAKEASDYTSRELREIANEVEVITMADLLDYDRRQEAATRAST